MGVTSVRGCIVEHAHRLWAWEAGHEAWHRASVGVHHAHCRRHHWRCAHCHLRHLRRDVALHRRYGGSHRCGWRWGSPILRGQASVSSVCPRGELPWQTYVVLSFSIELIQLLVERSCGLEDLVGLVEAQSRKCVLN